MESFRKVFASRNSPFDAVLQLILSLFWRDTQWRDRMYNCYCWRIPPDLTRLCHSTKQTWGNWKLFFAERITSPHNIYRPLKELFNCWLFFSESRYRQAFLNSWTQRPHPKLWSREIGRIGFIKVMGLVIKVRVKTPTNCLEFI